MASRAFGIDVETPPTLGDLGLTRGEGGARRTRIAITTQHEVAAGWSPTDAEVARQWLGADGSAVMVAYHRPGGGYLIDAPQEARILVSADGRSIRCACVGTDDDVKALLVGQALPLAAALQGLEPLHASAVVIDAVPVAIAAPSGAGKTTLAARLIAAGARLLTDDVLVLEAHAGRVVVHPGPTVLSLRTDADVGLLSTLAEQGSVRARRPKLRIEVPHERRCVPLGALYFLERQSAGAEAAIRPIEHLQPTRLLGQAYSSVVQTAERLRRTIDMCELVARGVPTFSLQAPAGRDADVAQMVAAHARGLT